MKRRKQALRWMIGLLFSAFLVLTFLSNTIQGLSLPKVTVEKPEMGGLELKVSGEGFLRPSQTAQLYAEGDWTVDTIHKRDGDRVKKGDPLVTFDTTSTKRSLQDERTRYEQKKLQLEKMTDQLKMALREGETAGIDNQKRDIRVQQLDMEVQQRKIADMEQQIAEGGTLKAPFEGVITSLNASEGATASHGQPVVEIADDASGYSFSFSANSDEASPLRVGEKVKVWIEETERRSVQGVISEIEDASDADNGGSDDTSKQITIDVNSAKLQPGMKVSITISHQSNSFGQQIAKSTIKSDNTGDYVFTITEKDGPLGSAYYVQKTYITVKDEDEDTVVADGLMPDDQIITETSEPLSEGDRVRYQNHSSQED